MLTGPLCLLDRPGLQGQDRDMGSPEVSGPLSRYLVTKPLALPKISAHRKWKQL